MKKTLSYILFLSVPLLTACEDEKAETGEIQYTMVEQIYEHPECVTVQGPCVTIHFIYPDFEGEGALNDSLTKWTEQKMYDPQFESQDMTAEGLADQWFSDFDHFAEEIEDYNLSWTLERRVELVFTTPNLVSLHFNEFSFTGGAHPTQIDIFRSFEIPDGNILTLSDLTHDESQLVLLTSLVEEEFRYSYELLEDENLEDAGYWFLENDFHLTENFAFTNYGLLFYFNVYEVAPYATGPIAVEIRYQDLESILHLKWLSAYEQLSLK